jgi:hypothetical protein
MRESGRNSHLLVIAVVTASAVALLSSGLRAQEIPMPTPTPTSTPRPAHRKALAGGVPEPRHSGGDSLADTVRSSKETHGGRKKNSLGTITNDSLKKPESGPVRKGHVILAPKDPVAPPPQGGAVAEPRDSSGRSETDWRALAAAGRKRIASAETEVKRLEDESKRLENEFYAWSDGNYRDRVIKPSWDQSKDELKKARIEIDQAQAAFADLEEDARKSGAPPGWLRETK